MSERNEQVLAWVDVGRKPVPHLREVIEAIPDHLSAGAANCFLMSPNDALAEGYGHPVAPVAWLLEGYDPDVIIELARRLQTPAYPDLVPVHRSVQTGSFDVSELPEDVVRDLKIDAERSSQSKTQRVKDR